MGLGPRGAGALGAGSPPPSTCLGWPELSWKLPATSPVAGPNWQKVHCHPNSTKTHAAPHTTCGPRGPGLGCALAVGPAPRAVGGPGVHAWGPLGRPQWPPALPQSPKNGATEAKGPHSTNTGHPLQVLLPPWLIGAARNAAMAHSQVLACGRLPPRQFLGSFRGISRNTLEGWVAPQWGKMAQI